jgi:hypothetical protein
MRIAELRKSECCPVIGQIEVALPFLGQHYLAGNGADFSVVLTKIGMECSPDAEVVSRSTLEGDNPRRRSLSHACRRIETGFGGFKDRALVAG